MEENIKEKSANKQQRSFFCRKIQIPLFGVLIIVVFISLQTYALISVNNRVKTLEDKKPIESVSTKSQEITADRTKRSTKPTKMDILTERMTKIEERVKSLEEKKPIESVSTPSQEMTGGRTKRSTKATKMETLTARLIKVEERLNQSYRSVGRQPWFVLKGPPGKPGRDGTPGRDGIPGTKSRDGRDGRDGAKGVIGGQGTPGQRGPQGISGQKGQRGNPGVSGVSYIRWGKKICPSTGAKLVYEGYVGGSHYNHKGGGANYVCLSRNPTYEKYQNGGQSDRALMYGAEYETSTIGIFPSSLYQHDVPCVRCHVDTRATQMMIPGQNVCPAGWTREYKGYLMAEGYSHHRTMFTCVDENPDYVRGTPANLNGALFYFAEGRCGSLPCKPYVNGRELTCAVCTR